MTSRCRTLIVMATLGLVLGLLREQNTLALVSLSMLVWIFITACAFYLRIALCWSRLETERSIRQNDAVTRRILWVDRHCRMRVVIRSRGGLIPAMTVARDLLPETINVPNSSHQIPAVHRKCTLDVEQLEIEYPCVPLAAGTARFFGVHFQFQDPQGFFLWERVLREKTSYRILPAYAEAGDPRPRIKRTNSLPQHGIHSLRRAGFGGELLELREYQTGDPPKSIAWKVSARRDRLMTRQFESEVPIRMTLIMDASPLVYGGLPGQRIIDQANYLAASIAKAAISVGDAVGLVLCQENEVFRLRPGHGDRAFYQILDSIAKQSQPSGIPSGMFSQELLELATDVCRERYPELVDPQVNRATVSFLVLRPKNRRIRRNRIQLAHVLAELYQLSSTETIELIHDDLKMAIYARRFLADNDRAWVPPVFEIDASSQSGSNLAVSQHGPASRGSGLSLCAGLAKQLSLSVAHAHDNEVFVIFTNLFDNRLFNPREEFEDLLPTIKMAMARHHRVVVIAGSTTGKRVAKKIDPVVPKSSTDVLEQAEQIRISRLSEQFSKKLRGIGATFAVSGKPNVIPVVMAEAELAGSGRFQARGTKA